MYQLSKDYARLFEMLLQGQIAVGFVDYHGFDVPQRDVCQIVRRGPYDIFIGVRGVTYGGVYPFHKKDGDEFNVFESACKMTNLEWVAGK